MDKIVKVKKVDMPESKIFPNRKFITMKEQKLKRNMKNLQENVIIDYVIYYVINYSCLKLISQKL